MTQHLMWLLLSCGVLLEACDPAEFRPARGVHDYPSEKTSYRVREIEPSCELIGHVVHTGNLDSIAETVANHGGTHYRIVDDFGGESLEIGWNSYSGGGNASARKVKHHEYAAEAYRCR